MQKIIFLTCQCTFFDFIYFFIFSNSTISHEGNDIENDNDSSNESDMEESSDQSEVENDGSEGENNGLETENNDLKSSDNEVSKDVSNISDDESSSEDESENENSDNQSEHETSSDEDIDKENNMKDISEKTEDEKSGWADAMAKVLNMGKNTAQTEPNKPLFLSKAIKDNEIKHRTSANLKENENNLEEPSTDQKVQIKASIRRAQKKEMEEKGRCKPDITKDRGREKMLCKLATKGVVQLFNAVREQQKTIKTQLNTAGGSVRKREKVYKNMDRQTFLNVLSNQGINKQSIESNSENQLTQNLDNSRLSKKPKLHMSHNVIKPENPPKEEIKEESIHLEESGGNESTWNVFRDDFMMGAKMKDWDKEESDSD